MKTLYTITLAVLCLSLSSCGSDDSNPSCGTYNGKTVYKGPQGGCYYNNSSGNKEYVDRSYCKC